VHFAVEATAFEVTTVIAAEVWLPQLAATTVQRGSQLQLTKCRASKTSAGAP